MATANNKYHCVACEKAKVAYKCEGCSHHFSFNHLADHRQLLGKQLVEIEDKRNLFRQTLTEQKANSQNHVLTQQIDKWERDSIKKIQQTAEEARESLFQHTSGYIDEIEMKLSKLTAELKHIQEEHDIDESILDEFKQKLSELEEKLVKLSNVTIQQDSTSFIRKITVVLSSRTYIHILTNENLYLSQKMRLFVREIYLESSRYEPLNPYVSFVLTINF